MPTTQQATIRGNLSHSHGLDTIAGYSIVATRWNETGRDVRRTEVAQVNGSTNYAHALELVHAERATVPSGVRGYAVIDTLYTCGCRSDAIDLSLVR